MRKIITTIMIFIFTISFGQKTNQIKLYYGFVKGDYIPSQDLDGAGLSNSFKTNEIGIRYNKKISKIFRIETGINYFSSEIIIESAPMPEISTFKDNLQLATIPLSLITEFWKYFYVNSGVLIDFQTKDSKYLDSQSGIGFVLGLGAKYEYKDFIFYLNPEIRRHRLIGFKSEKYPEFLINSTIQLGLGYNF
ncbi:porin family protein [Tenacibaculum finnmarkense]|uniref:porin family protein n=1 Tax=Tenacibaculum finnmarkense TaxID=2781243 RepID=UPI001E52EA44|nr:porin family protein [Tenacibaculum finnmarkense]MCD8445753.1 porin family protein [Tenacibaculum finnmarkense genomovar ulcerans]MCD8448057.1 porin family protein [Tenacibaculum finnmarkense genomovar finnmarkense]MCG8239752.1 outer membrane beta-barrel protein [Tenacibaculum finnmarkense genomovar ulcerans]MCG8806448.1 porin family protein [Tenacibaculum finnmarkense]MCG8857561.1 porin family protein [Tenacibaculum finnmarkense]